MQSAENQILNSNFRASKILSSGFAVIKQRFGIYIAFVLFGTILHPGIQLIAHHIFGAAWPALSTVEEADVFMTRAELISSFIGHLGNGFIVTLVVCFTYAQLTGRPLGAGGSTLWRSPAFFSGWMSYLLFQILLVIGFILLIIPGIIVLCALWVVIPIAIVERLNPIAAIGRSFELTRLKRFKILQIHIIFFVIYFLSAFLMNPISGLLPPSLLSLPIEIYRDSLLTAVYEVINAVLATYGYYLIVHDEEYFRKDKIERVFS